MINLVAGERGGRTERIWTIRSGDVVGGKLELDMAGWAEVNGYQMWIEAVEDFPGVIKRPIAPRDGKSSKNVSSFCLRKSAFSRARCQVSFARLRNRFHKVR